MYDPPAPIQISLSAEIKTRPSTLVMFRSYCEVNAIASLFA